MKNANKLILGIGLSFFSHISSAAEVKLISNDTLSKNCGSQGVYVGPNRADKHGGSCLYMTGRNINHVITATYTLNKANDCPSMHGRNVYVGPWKDREHGGYCLSSDSGYHFNVSKTLDRKRCSASPQYGGRVYVGPWKEHEHGGYCLSILKY